MSTQERLGADDRRTSERWEKRLTVAVNIWVLFYAMCTAGALFLHEAPRFVTLIALAAAISLVALGLTGPFTSKACPARPRPRRRRDRLAREGFDRLCVAAGVAQIAMVLLLPSLLAVLLGGAMNLALLCRGVRRPGGEGRPDRRPRSPRAGVLVVAVIGIMFVAYSGLAVALILSGSPRQRAEGGEPPDSIGEDGGVVEASEPELTYAELCPALPNPLEIGHDLGELFERIGAVKAGCGTDAIRVGTTGTWVSAGMCVGQRTAVAVSSPSHKVVMLYGEAAEFAWAAAMDGHLASVEVASPNGGDVVLVETMGNGTTAFVRSTQNAVPGNPDARRCNEVGGEPEPFARLEPPLVALWQKLLERTAAWSWPAAENGESIIFVSSNDVAGEGWCESEYTCSLESEERTETYDGIAYVNLADLAPYIPPEEPQA
jgi:hypothetical protein